MLVTVKNVSGVTMNDLEAITGGTGPSAVNAVGGNRLRPLPYPFGHIGALTDTSTKQLPMHPADWTFKIVPSIPMQPREEWNNLVQAGKVTLTVVAQNGRRDQFELFMNVV